MAMLLDNNLGGDMGYAKELLREIAKLKLWALGTEFQPFTVLQDNEFVDLLLGPVRHGLYRNGVNRTSQAFQPSTRSRTRWRSIKNSS